MVVVGGREVLQLPPPLFASWFGRSDISNFGPNKKMPLLICLYLSSLNLSKVWQIVFKIKLRENHFVKTGLNIELGKNYMKTTL